MAISEWPAMIAILSPGRGLPGGSRDAQSKAALADLRFRLDLRPKVSFGCSRPPGTFDAAMRLHFMQTREVIVFALIGAVMLLFGGLIVIAARNARRRRESLQRHRRCRTARALG